MATFRDKVVDVTLVYGSGITEVARFDIPLILATHNSSANLVDTFTSADAILQAGYTESSPVYKMATLLFTGLAAPEYILVGKRTLTDYSVTFTAVNSSIYTVTLKDASSSKTFSYTSDSSATVAEIAAGLQGLISADGVWSTKITATVVGSNTLNLAPVSGQHVDVAVGSNSVLSRNTSQSVTDAITAIATANNTFFWVVSDSHTNADITALAAYAEAHDKIYTFSTQDVNVRDKVSGNILETLNGLSYRNTWCSLWKSDADISYPEASAVGQIAASQPGTTTMHGKSLVGITPEKLTATQESNIVSLNGNIYRREYGINFYRDGRTVSGQFVDAIHQALYTKAKMEESIYNLFREQSQLLSGVRNTQAGRDQLRQRITADVIQPQISNGSIVNEIDTSSDTGLKKDLRPMLTIPSRADATTESVNERLIDGIVLEYVYAGFLHYAKVRINVLTDRTATA